LAVTHHLCSISSAKILQTLRTNLPTQLNTSSQITLMILRISQV
jgi:hypothetical protein